MVDPGDHDAHFGAGDAVEHAHGGVGEGGGEDVRVHLRRASAQCSHVTALEP